MRQRAIQGQRDIEMRVIALLGPGSCAREEGHDEVRVMPLWPDVGRRIRFADVEFAQHLRFGVPALRRVTPDLPAPPQLLGWIEKDAYTVGVAHLLPVHAEQPLDDQKGPWDDVLWWAKVAPFMIVVRLQDGFSGTQQLQMLCHHIEIVACRVQGRDAQLLALLSVIAMVIVRAEHRDTLRAQNLSDASTQRRLASGTVSHDPQDDRTRAKWYSHIVLQPPCAGCPWSVTRRNCLLSWYTGPPCQMLA